MKPFSDFQAKPEQFLELLNVFANENGLAKLRHPENNMNILHYVLHHRRRDLATMIAERVEPAVFSQECDVTVAAIKGKKTALHYVTELNDLQLAKLILNKVRKPCARLHSINSLFPLNKMSVSRSFPILEMKLRFHLIFLVE